MSAAVERELAAHLVGPRASGIVTATQQRLKRLFCLEDRRLVHVASNVVEEQWRPAFLAAGLVDATQLDAAEARARADGLKLPAALQTLGLVEPERLRQTAEGHARRLLFSTLEWGRGEVSFAPGRPQLDGEYRLDLDPGALLADYARQSPGGSTKLRQRIGPPSVRLVAVPDALTRPGVESAGPAARHVLSRADAGAALAKLLEGAPDAAESTLRTIYALILLGALVVAETPATPIMETKGQITADEVVARLKRAAGADPYQTLELMPTATTEDIRNAYYFLARRYHPDRFRAGPLANLLPGIEAFFSQVTEAYNTLFDPASRLEYDRRCAEAAPAAPEPEQDAAYLARENFARARILLGRGRNADASTFLENAVQLDGQHAEYRLELGRLLCRNPRRRDEAQRHLEEAIRLEPARAEAYVVLGQLLRRLGHPEQAADTFREALRWDPDHADALRELNEMAVG